MASPSNSSSSRKSSEESCAPRTYTEQDIWPDSDAAQIALSRQESRREVLSVASDYQNPPTLSSKGEDLVPKAGDEFQDLDPEIVTWDGPNDLQNPRNWTKMRKHKITVIVALLSFMPGLTSSIMSPVVPRILATYNNSNSTVGSLMVSIMLMTWGPAALILAPSSEVWGRRLILLAAATGGTAFNLGCAWSPTTATMLVFRALGGLFNVAPLTVGAGCLADLYTDEERMWPLAWWGLAPSLGPVFGPIISGFIAQFGDWRWAFWAAAAIQGAIGILAVIGLPEIHAPVILSRKCKALIRQTGNHNLHTIWELTGGSESLSRKMRLAVQRPILFLLTNPVIFGLGLHLAFVYALMYLVFVTFDMMWEQYYGYSIWVSNLMFVSLGIGMLLGVIGWTPTMNAFIRHRARQDRGRPEDKLAYLAPASLEMAAGIFWYGWSAQAHTHWIVPNLGMAFFGGGIFVAFQAIQSYVVELNPRLASSAVAALVLARCLLASAFPLFGAAMYKRLDYGWADTLIGLLMVVLGVPFPVILYNYGPQLRAWSDRHSVVK